METKAKPVAAKPVAPTKVEAKLLRAGGDVGARAIDLAPYGTARRRKLVKQVVVAYLANQRQGTHKVKKRAETSYSEARPWPQKHTGRARSGDKNSPLWRHGGTIFGPVPRDYRHHTPRGMLREALRSSLFGKFVDGEIAFIERLEIDPPSTKTAVKCLQGIGITGGVTVVLPKGGDKLYRSFRNIDGCDVVAAGEVNALHALRRRHLVFVGDALAEVDKRLAGGHSRVTPVPA